MKLNINRYYPYPVVKPYLNDYKKGSFVVEVDINIDCREYLILRCNMSLTSNKMKDLIRINDAQAMIHVEGPVTKYRSVFPIAEGDNIIKIDLKYLNGTIDVLPVIVALKQMEFHDDDFLDIFENHKFRFNVGNVLAIDHHKRITIDKDTHERSSIPSIITIQTNLDQKEAISFDLKQQKIAIMLSQSAMKVYQPLTGRSKNHKILNSMLIMPVLTAAIMEIKEDLKNNGNGRDDFRWYRMLVKKLGEHNIDIESEKFREMQEIKIAQLLLDDIILQGLNDLQKVREEAV